MVIVVDSRVVPREKLGKETFLIGGLVSANTTLIWLESTQLSFLSLIPEELLLDLLIVYLIS